MSSRVNLAEATAALGRKEAEKGQVLEEIQKLEELQMEGVVALLHGSVYGLQNLPENLVTSFTYRYFPADASEHTIEHTNKATGEAARIQLPAKSGKLSIVCRLAPAPGDEESEIPVKELNFVANIDLSEVPEDTEMRTEITATLVTDGSETQSELKSLVLNLKASIDDVASMIVSKTVAMEQLHLEFDEIAAQVQEAKKKPATSKTAKAKTGKKTVSKRKSVESTGNSRARETDAGEEDEAASAPAPPSFFDGLKEKVMTGAEYVFERRAYVLFPVVAAVFHFYGDYASV